MHSAHASSAPKEATVKVLSREAQALIRQYVPEFKDLSQPLPGTVELQQQALEVALRNIAGRGEVSELNVIMPYIENLAAQDPVTKRTALHMAARTRNWRCYAALEEYARNTFRHAGTLLPDSDKKIPAHYWDLDYIKRVCPPDSLVYSSVKGALLALEWSSIGTRNAIAERKQAAASDPLDPAKLKGARRLSPEEVLQSVSKPRESMATSLSPTERKASSPGVTPPVMAGPKPPEDKSPEKTSGMEGWEPRDCLQFQEVLMAFGRMFIGMLKLKIVELKMRSLSGNAVSQDVFSATRTAGQIAAPSDEENDQQIAKKLNEMVIALGLDVIKKLYTHILNNDTKSFLEAFLDNGGAAKLEALAKDVLKGAVPTATSPNIQAVAARIVRMVEDKRGLTEEETLQRAQDSCCIC